MSGTHVKQQMSQTGAISTDLQYKGRVKIDLLWPLVSLSGCTKESLPLWLFERGGSTSHDVSVVM